MRFLTVGLCFADGRLEMGVLLLRWYLSCHVMCHVRSDTPPPCDKRTLMLGNCLIVLSRAVLRNVRSSFASPIKQRFVWPMLYCSQVVCFGHVFPSHVSKRFHTSDRYSTDRSSRNRSSTDRSSTDKWVIYR